jgi:hypothetical protein
MEKIVKDIMKDYYGYIPFIDIFNGLYIDGLKLTYLYLNEKTDTIHFFSNDIEVFPSQEKKYAIFATIIDNF